MLEMEGGLEILGESIGERSFLAKCCELQCGAQEK